MCCVVGLVPIITEGRRICPRGSLEQFRTAVCRVGYSKISNGVSVVAGAKDRENAGSERCDRGRGEL